MKVFNKLAACISAVLVLTACGKEDGAVNNEEVAVRFSVQIGEQTGEVSAQTRASGDQWAQGDSIGVYAFLNGTDTPGLDMENKKYDANEAGSTPDFLPADGLDIYYPVNGSDVFGFIAYYPYKKSGSGPGEITDYIYPVDVSGQADPAAIDLLYAKNMAGYSKYNPHVDFIFRHKLSKFTLQTVPGEGGGLTFADLENMTVRISGMNTVAEFDLLTGDLTNPADRKIITPKTVTKGKLYEAIVLPANNTGTPWTVEFIVNGNTYVWDIPANTQFEEGYEYIWKISVQKTPVTISSSIIPFTTVTDDGVAW